MLQEHIERLYNHLTVCFPTASVYNNVAPTEAGAGDFVVFSVGVENVNVFLGGVFVEVVYMARVICVFEEKESAYSGIDYLITAYGYNVNGMDTQYDNEVGKTVIALNIFLNS